MSNQNKSSIVLVVDDDESLQKILVDKLSEQDIKVIIAATGIEALEQARLIPGLILLDIMLKGPHNGFDVLEELKRDAILKTIPVIVLTNLEGEQKSALNIGAIDYIVKTDVTIDEIVLKVKNVLAMT